MAKAAALRTYGLASFAARLTHNKQTGATSSELMLESTRIDWARTSGET